MSRLVFEDIGFGMRWSKACLGSRIPKPARGRELQKAQSPL